MKFTDFSAGRGEVFSYATSGIEAFIGPVQRFPTVTIRETMEFVNPEWQRRWDAFNEEEREQYIRVVKEIMMLETSLLDSL